MVCCNLGNNMIQTIISDLIIIMEIDNQNRFKQIWIGNITLIYLDLSLKKKKDKN